MLKHLNDNASMIDLALKCCVSNSFNVSDLPPCIVGTCNPNLRINYMEKKIKECCRSTYGWT